MIDDFDPNSTEISTTSSYIIHPDDICYCDKDFLDNGNYDCGCTQNPRVTWLGVNVRITQRPIKTTPINSVYSIRCFEAQTYESDVYDRNLFCPENMKAEFSISDSISYESEKTYIDFLKRYVVTGKNNRDVVAKESSYSFRGKQSNDSYLKAFKNIVQKMINNFDKKKEDSKNTENPHVSRRKK